MSTRNDFPDETAEPVGRYYRTLREDIVRGTIVWEINGHRRGVAMADASLGQVWVTFEGSRRPTKVDRYGLLNLGRYTPPCSQAGLCGNANFNCRYMVREVAESGEVCVCHWLSETGALFDRYSEEFDLPLYRPKVRFIHRSRY